MTKLSGQKTSPTKKKLARTGEENRVFSACITGFFFVPIFLPCVQFIFPILCTIALNHEITNHEIPVTGRRTREAGTQKYFP